MNNQVCCEERPAAIVLSDDQWCSLLALLQPFVLWRVRRARLVAWRGQEEDVALDITYTAIRKVIEYLERARQEGIEIGSLKNLAIVTARHQFLDTLRKDSRLLRGEAATRAIEESRMFSAPDPEEYVLDKLEEEALFKGAAVMVQSFSTKLRLAMLADIARRMEKHGDFHGRPTVLRQAFVDVGIDLEEYVPRTADTPVVRSRRASLISIGYRRIAEQKGR